MRLSQASSTITILASADAVWQVISAFGAAGKVLAEVIDCTYVGAGVGAVRTLTLADGSMLIERLEALDEAAYQLSYALLTDTPFGNCLTTLSLGDLDRGVCQLRWSATFQANGLPKKEAVTLLKAALAANCLALKQYMEVGEK